MTRENSGMSCVKYMLFTTNVMFLLIGVLLVLIGIAVKSVYQDFDRFMLTEYYTPSNLVIAVGFIIFFVAFLGFIGAILESTFIVNMYALALAIVFLLELTAAIVAYTQRYSIRNSVAGNLETALLNYRDVSGYSYDKQSWDFLQNRLECCGIYSYKDWKRNHWNFAGNCSSRNPAINITIPDSCFEDDVKCQPQTNFYKNGCLDTLDVIVSECALLLGCGALCIAFVQLLAVIFARLLASSIRNLKTQRLVRQQQRRERLFQDLYAPEISVQEKQTYIPTGLPEKSDTTA